MLGCLSILKRLRGAAIPINLCVFQAVLVVVFGFFFVFVFTEEQANASFFLQVGYICVILLIYILL